MQDRRASGDDAALAAAEKIARAMDGLHLDPILGLVAPWAGDAIGAALGLYPVVLAWRRGVPRTLLARMLLNLGVDLVAGTVPIVGDVWDFFFRAHSRNAALLRERSIGGKVVSRKGDALIVAGAVLFFLAALALPIILLVLALRALLG